MARRAGARPKRASRAGMASLVSSRSVVAHAHPSPACPVGGHIHDVLDGPLFAAQDALRASLAQTTIAGLLAKL